MMCSAASLLTIASLSMISFPAKSYNIRGAVPERGHLLLDGVGAVQQVCFIRDE